MKKLGIRLNGKEYIVTVREIIDDDKDDNVVDVDNNSSDNTIPDNTESGTNTEPEVPEEDKLTDNTITDTTIENKESVEEIAHPDSTEEVNRITVNAIISFDLFIFLYLS